MRHIHDAVEDCKSQFFKRISDPAIASHSQAKPALEEGLKSYLKDLNHEMKIIAARWRMTALTAACDLSSRFSQMDVHQPQLANKRPQVVEPSMVDQDSDAYVDADAYADADKSTIQHRANQMEDSSSRYQNEEEELKLVSPVKYMSRAVTIGTRHATTTAVHVMHVEACGIAGLRLDGTLYSFNKSAHGSWLMCCSTHHRHTVDSHAAERRGSPMERRASSSRC